MNKITRFITAGFTCLLAGTATAQNSTQTAAPPAAPKFYIGPGIGMTYAGVAGIKAEYVFVKHFSVFAGAGYYLCGLGYTFGATAKLLPNRRFSPLLYGMYGSNAAINVEGARQYNEIYTGPSVGIGADLKVGRGGNKLFFGLQYAFWHPDFRKDFEVVKQQPEIEIYNDPIPVGFNFGFNFAIKSAKGSRK